MAIYDVLFYNADPFNIFSRTTSGFAVWTGPATADGTATITDNGAGTDSLSLEDDNAGETATADVTIGALSSTGARLSAEEGWTLRDTVTGEIFQVVTFRVIDGGAIGEYTLSEIPLVPGRTYETLVYDSLPQSGTTDPVFTYADFTGFNDGIVEGTSGDDVIDTSYTGDPDGDMIDGADKPGTTFTTLDFNWSVYGDETNVSGGVTQNTGGIDVTMSYSGPAGREFTSDTNDPIYVGAGEGLSTTSSAFLYQNGSSQDAYVTFDFAASSGSPYADEVYDVSFRINDIDGLSDGVNFFQDIITITAYDADGNEVPVDITISGDDSLSGNTITAAMANHAQNDIRGSALVQISGPVSQIVIQYDNGGNTQQAIWLSDIKFDAVTPTGADDDTVYAGDGNDIVSSGRDNDLVYGEAGNDTLDGGSGADTLDGGTGADTIYVGGGDLASGGDGDDLFIVSGALLDGNGITVIGGEGDETAGDTLDFNGQLLKGSIVYTETDDTAGGLSGTATLLDGSTLTFSNIEEIICFTTGTQIETPFGPRPVEDLVRGDWVLTVDNGPQRIRWISRRTVDAAASLAPIVFAKGSIGNRSELLLSPQHRVLISDYRAQLYFGEDEVIVAAKHLIDGQAIRQAAPGVVTYHHFLFDRHEIVLSEGAATESYHPGAVSLPGLDPAAREELFEIFPELRADPIAFGPSARLSLRAAQGRLLAA